jgi:hypothetical protein
MTLQSLGGNHGRWAGDTFLHDNSWDIPYYFN